MEYENKFPEWGSEVEGTTPAEKFGEPSENLKKEGFKPGYKPPANIFNWFWSLVSKAITELQEKLTAVFNAGQSHEMKTNNPHSVTAEQVGAWDKDTVNMLFYNSNEHVTEIETNVNNHFLNVTNPHYVTAEQTGAYTKTQVDNKITEVREITTVLEETKADVNLMNVDDEIFRTKVINTGGINVPVVEATSTDGITYTATVSGMTKLENGTQIIIVPNTSNTTTSPKLNINGLGEVQMRRPLSFATFVANAPEVNHIRANTPCRLMYHANYTSGGIWLIAEKQKTSAQDLYGVVPLASGGTGYGNEDTEGAFYAEIDDDNKLKGHYGILPMEFGGTGVGTEADFKHMLSQYGFPRFAKGSYVGDGSKTTKTIKVGVTPKWVMITGSNRTYFAMPTATLTAGSTGTQGSYFDTAGLSFGSDSITLTVLDKDKDETDTWKSIILADEKDETYHWIAILS